MHIAASRSVRSVQCGPIGLSNANVDPYFFADVVLSRCAQNFIDGNGLVLVRGFCAAGAHVGRFALGLKSRVLI